jgi:hypothetical protein
MGYGRKLKALNPLEFRAFYGVRERIRTSDARFRNVVV